MLSKLGLNVTGDGQELYLSHQQHLLGKLPVIQVLDQGANLSRIQKVFGRLVLEVNDHRYVVSRRKLARHCYEVLGLKTPLKDEEYSYQNLLEKALKSDGSFFSKKPSLESALSQKEREQATRKLFAAIVAGKTDEAVKWMYSGASLNREAIVREGFPVAFSLAELKAQIQPDQSTKFGHHYCTPLLLAAQRGQKELCGLLVEAGADTSAQVLSVMFQRVVNETVTKYDAQWNVIEREVHHVDQEWPLVQFGYDKDSRELRFEKKLFDQDAKPLS